MPIEFNWSMPYSKILTMFSSGVQDGDEYNTLVNKYGKCKIVLPEKGTLAILFEQILSPFYIFQIWSWALWFSDDYEIYASCILLTSIISVVVELLDIKRNLRNLKNMVNYECSIKVKRIDKGGNEYYKEILSNDLVPGDVFIVPENLKMPCDAIQLTGSSIMNESMLTGESIPVIKNPIPNIDHEVYNPEDDKMYTLYSGTEVIQNRIVAGLEATGLVIRTNFDTLKGSLIKSILFPKPNRFNFYSDSLKFIAVLSVFSVVGFLISLKTSLDNLSTKEIIFKGLDLITITVPPALPAAMSAGLVFAMSRLKKESIFCISPHWINVAGRVKSIVFDKTGTLTEDSLRFKGVTVADNNEFDFLTHNLDNLSKEMSNRSELWEGAPDPEEIREKWIQWMVTWHSIAQVQDRFIGDPLDIEMFEATKWILSEQISLNKEGFIELDNFYPQGNFFLNIHILNFQ